MASVAHACADIAKAAPRKRLVWGSAARRDRLGLLDAIADKVEVDVVSDGGRTWTERKAVEPFGLDSTNWKGDGSTQGLSRQAEELLHAASQNPVIINGEAVVPRVVVEFPQGVSQEVADALSAMGVEVRGAIVYPQ